MRCECSLKSQEKEKKGAKLAQLVALVKFAFMISRSHNCHKVRMRFFSNKRATYIEQHSIALIFEIRDTTFFKIKRFIKINPSLLLKTKRV